MHRLRRATGCRSATSPIFAAHALHSNKIISGFDPQDALQRPDGVGRSDGVVVHEERHLDQEQFWHDHHRLLRWRPELMAADRRHIPHIARLPLGYEVLVFANSDENRLRIAGQHRHRQAFGRAWRTTSSNETHSSAVAPPWRCCPKARWCASSCHARPVLSSSWTLLPCDSWQTLTFRANERGATPGRRPFRRLVRRFAGAFDPHFRSYPSRGAPQQNRSGRDRPAESDRGRAEGATAPETLRQKDRTVKNSGKQAGPHLGRSHRRRKPRGAPVIWPSR